MAKKPAKRSSVKSKRGGLDLSSARTSITTTLRRRWPVSVGLGLLIVFGVYMLFTRPASGKLDQANADLQQAKATTEALTKQRQAVQQLNPDDVSSTKAKVQKYDALLPFFPKDRVDGSVSDVLLSVPQKLKNLPFEALQSEGCTTDKTKILDFGNASDLSKGPETVSGVPAGYAVYQLRFFIPEGVCTGGDSKVALYRAIAMMQELNPLTVIKSLRIDAPLPEGFSDGAAASLPGYTVDATLRVYVSFNEGLAERVPRPVPVLSLAGWESQTGPSGQVKPGEASYHPVGSNNETQSVSIVVVYPGDNPPPGSELIYVPLNEKWDVVVPAPNGDVGLAISFQGTPPATAQEIAEKVELHSYVSEQKKLTAAAEPGK